MPRSGITRRKFWVIHLLSVITQATEACLSGLRFLALAGAQAKENKTAACVRGGSKNWYERLREKGIQGPNDILRNQ